MYNKIKKTRVMNWKRALGGFILSFVFLASFVYITAVVQYFISGYYLGQDSSVLASNLSSGIQNAVFSVSTNTEDGNTSLPVIDAGAAISVESDLKTPDKIIFRQNINGQFPIASLTKLMTAVIVLENPDNKYNSSNIIAIDKEADSQFSLKQDLKLGDAFSVKNLLNIMLVESSNKAAYALSEQIGEKNFVELMNQRAKLIGLSSTVFDDPTGLSSSNISTANDLVTLIEYILNEHPKIAQISREKEVYIPGFGSVINTDELLEQVPNVVCSKTGFTTAAKGCLLLVTKNPSKNDYLINIVLGADDRFSQMQDLISWSNSMCQ